MLGLLSTEGTLKAFRRLLQRTPVYGAFKSLGHYPDYWYWILRGRPARSPHLLKQKVVREYGEKFGLRTLVETGTYYGETLRRLRRCFDQLHSIELSVEFHRRAKERFAGDSKIHLWQGDSGEILVPVIEDVVKDMDLEGRKVTVEAVPGLID